PFDWPAGYTDWLSGDIDHDGIAELWRFGSAGLEVLRIGGAVDLSTLSLSLNEPIDGLTRCDLDRDGDEEIIAVGPSGLNLWSSNRGLLDPDYTPALLTPTRGTPGPRDARGVSAMIDRSGAFNFEEELLLRPWGETIIPLQSEDRPRLLFRFPDRNAAGGNSLQYEAIPGERVELSDPQAE
ncbi:MAG: hypothetical protein VYD19_06290, partial [Myxococcota bacterium]|nr:hypothetical protein [Myxococcota bacterium]